MSLVSRLGIVLAILVVTFGAAMGLGGLVGGALGDPGSESVGWGADDGHGHETGGVTVDSSQPDGAHAGHGEATSADAVPGGLQVSAEGYTLDLPSATATAGSAVPVTFRVLGPGGTPVTGYDVTHDKELHLVAVRRDLSGFQHVHPVRAADGTWSVPLDLTAGDWRLIADFAPAGHETVILGADLAVAGAYTPVALPAASSVAEVDGYEVSLSGALRAGQESAVALTVSRDGKPVTDLQPYLAAYGHLVALRQGDLAYLHVHPDGEPGDGKTPAGPQIVFHTTAPTAGTYRLYLDFQHQGVVRTAEFTVVAEEG